MNRLFKLAVIAAGTILAGVAMAATSTSPMNVSATVGAGGACTVTAYPINFGSVDGSIQVEVPTSVDVNCTSGTPYTVAFDAGLNFGPSGFRTVQNPAGDPIVYGIVDDASGLEVGDDCGANTYPLGLCLGGTGIGATETTNLTALMPEAANFPSNIYTVGTSYSDTINVTLEF
jgi:spore coat protein U-like protein